MPIQELPAQPQSLVHDTPKETEGTVCNFIDEPEQLTALPEFNGKTPAVEPDRKADFKSWCEFHRTELVDDRGKLSGLDFMHRWGLSLRQIGDMKEVLGLARKKQVGSKHEKADREIITPNAQKPPVGQIDGKEGHFSAPTAATTELTAIQDVFNQLARVSSQYERLINLLECAPKTELPALPEFKDVPDDCKAKWFEIYGKLIEGE